MICDHSTYKIEYQYLKNRADFCATASLFTKQSSQEEKRHARGKLIGILLKGSMSIVLFVLNCKWQVRFLSKNLVNYVEIKLLAK